MLMTALIRYAATVTLAILMCAGQGCAPVAADPAMSDAHAKSSATEVAKVTTVKPTRKLLQKRTEQPGQIEPFAETAVFAKVTGYVKRVLVDIGDHVEGPRYSSQDELIKSGQTLAELWVPELDEEVNQKAALVRQAQAEVEQATASVAVAVAMQESATSLVQEAQAAEGRSEAAYQRWKSESERITSLVEKKAVTEKLAEETLQQFKSADAARSETNARIQSAKAKLAESQAQIDKAKADHKTAVAKQQVAEADLGRVTAMSQYKTLTAPFDGVVTTRNIDPGHLAHASQGAGDRPLFKVVQVHKVRVFIDVPETDAVLVEQTREARIRVPALGSEVFKGEVSRTAWSLNAETRTLKVEIDIPNTHGKLRPGMYVYVDLLVAEKADALVLPKGAILSSESGTFCLLVDAQSKVVRRPIKTGLKAGQEVEVTDGLTGDEDVISANASAFQDGQSVERVLTK